MNKLKHIFFILLIPFLISCSRGVHPIVQKREQVMNNEIKVKIIVADNIHSARINHFKLKNGINYIKITKGIHTIYWTKNGDSKRWQVELDKTNRELFIY